ncbi:hypothetical protein I601_1259 [Nocardioides dokdonensis FR1436]|uniref:Uncharacterized protein n=1 Tax=Nocardioides dokdonensis FR1436 TaxID=1300347 RepID=A0A1A9GJM5_9ACTN|nr:hypothetical protein [Nocardioides dokdonensis]ANH37701.1 hypothetical protein I601_1259 [Nocardioides dokdonensis FR1436]
MTAPVAPSPEEEARLRRLLADARHEAPVPADVGARLDEVLGRLEAGEDVPSGISGTGVLEFAAARRRRVASMLVAAAAVVVVGIGLGQVVDLDGAGSGGDASSPEAGAGVAESSDRDESPDRSETSADAGEGSKAAQDSLSSGRSLSRQGPTRGVVVLDGRLPRISEKAFGDDVTRLQQRAVRDGGAPSARLERLRGAPRPVLRAWRDCAPAAWGEGILVAVLSGNDAAVLAFRPPAGDSQVVDLLQCGTGGVLRTTTLPRR